MRQGEEATRNGSSGMRTASLQRIITHSDEWTVTMSDWRLKWGKISPTVWSNGAEFRPMMPPGVDLYAVTLGVRRTNDEDLSRASDSRLEAAKLLEHWDADCVVAGGAPISALDGIEAEEAFIEETQAELSIPFTTALRAQIDALGAVGAESVVSVSPFTPDHDEAVKAYLEHFGIDVVATGGARIKDVSEINDLPRSASYRHAMELLAEVDDEFDAIYVPCIPYGGVEYIEALEEDTGRPVVMSSQAQLWKALEMGGVSPHIEGFGRLFATL